MLKKFIAGALIAGAALTAAACGSYGYTDAGPAYVVGHYTCTDPYSGQPDYCVEYNNGYSTMVPWSIYSTISYGMTLNYVNHHWYTTRSSYYRRGVVADVYHVRYRQYTRSTTRSYTGMSFRRNGVVSYGSPRTSYRSYSFRSYSGRH